MFMCVRVSDSAYTSVFTAIFSYLENVCFSRLKLSFINNRGLDGISLYVRYLTKDLSAILRSRSSRAAVARRRHNLGCEFSLLQVKAEERNEEKWACGFELDMEVGR